MSDYAYPLFPVFAFLGFFLPLIPLAWHLQAWNSGTCFYILWVSLTCLNQFVNSVVWNDNALNLAPIWCDISSRIIIASSVALPTASLCINRRLYHIARLDGGGSTHHEKKRAVVVDSILCLGIPALQLAAYYIVQGHRFNIYEDVGCFPAVVDTLVSIFVFEMWPIVIGAVSAVYCVMSLRALFQRQAQFNQFLVSNKSITISRYVRLMALAMMDIIFTVPIATFALVLNCLNGLDPYINWANIHYDFSRVEQIPSVMWRLKTVEILSLELTRWSGPFCALLFFAFFGFAEEARRNYAIVGRALLSPFTAVARALGSRLPSSLRSTARPLHSTASTVSFGVQVSTSTWRSTDGDLEKGLASPAKAKLRDSFAPHSPMSPSDDTLPLYELHHSA